MACITFPNHDGNWLAASIDLNGHHRSEDAQQYSGDWTWTPNSTWVNDFRLGYVYIRNLTVGGDANLLPSNPWPNGYGMNTGRYESTLRWAAGNHDYQFHPVSGGGGGRTGRRGPQGDVDLVGTVSPACWVSTPSSLVLSIWKTVYDGDAYPVAQGAVNLHDLGKFPPRLNEGGRDLLGDPNAEYAPALVRRILSGRLADSPHVTLNLGLRYDYYASPTERNNYLGNFNPNVNPATTPAVEQFGPGAPLASEYNAGWGHVSPRLGVAWDVRGDGKTVVRAGAASMSFAQSWGRRLPNSVRSEFHRHRRQQ